MFRNRFFRKLYHPHVEVLDNGYYVGFISKSRIYTIYRGLLIQFPEKLIYKYIIL